MANSLEDEIQVLRSCQRQLDKLTPRERSRVLTFLSDAAQEAAYAPVAAARVIGHIADHAKAVDDARKALENGKPEQELFE